ncbi:MAG: hypothetical protein ABEJ42_08075 [Halobacteriaceae archaeon]
MAGQHSRRSVLGLIAAGGVAGCAAPVSTQAGDGDPNTTKSERLGNLLVTNAEADEAVMVEVSLSDSTGSTIYKNTYDLDGEEAVVETDLPEATGEYTVTISGGGAQTVEAPVETDSKTDCVDLSVHYVEGEFWIFFDEDSPPWGGC